MPQQSMIWTVLPNGISKDGKSLRFSVLVSPRLDPESQPTKLESFYDFCNWPDLISKAQFTLQVGTKSISLDASNIDTAVGVPDQKLWTALFPKETFVRKFAMRDRTTNQVVSYDTVGLHGALAGVYANLTINAGDVPPAIEELLGQDSPVTGIVAAVGEVDRLLADKEGKTRNIPALFEAYRDKKKFDKMKGAKFAEFQLFHTSPNEVTTQTVEPHDKRTPVTWQTHKHGKFDADKAVAELDFHQLLSAMNPYPTLLRKLGIVVDFLVPRASVSQSNDLALSVLVTLPAAPLPDNAAKFVKRVPANPTTHTTHSATYFGPMSRPSPDADDLTVSNGLLKLDTKSFALLQADVDGGGHKLMNFARTLGRHTNRNRQVDPTSKLARHAGAPALRNAGLMLVHVGRGRALSGAFKRNDKLNSSVVDLFTKLPSAKADLYAEDLIRGWRFDILDKTTNKWRSLCERTASYDINKGEFVLRDLREEGTIRLAATSSTDGSNPDVVFLHEAVTVWNGWSLVAQQPGKAVDVDEQKQRDAQADMPEGVRLKTAFAPVPGSLPRLRFGRAYAMRARSVDLAGNSLPPSQLDYYGDNSAPSAQPYLRFEPVQPPGFALIGTPQRAQLPLQGESMARMAVRSMNNQFDDATPTDKTADRWAVAPRTSQRDAELHGMFDGDAWGTPPQFALLVERDKELAQFPVTPDPAPAAVLSGPISSKPSKKKPNTPPTPTRVSTADDIKVAKFAVLPTGATALPYLPDPLCKRVVARFLNHPSINAHTLIEIPLYDDDKVWPDASPRLIHVYENNNEVPRYDAASRTLLVPTPKGTRATVRLSSMLEPDKLDLMGVWNWVPKDKQTAILKQRAQVGRLWPLTPVRELEIVHAVQRPLLKPDIVNMVLSRGAGDTWVRPTVLAECHRNTTVKVDFRGAWNDPRDNPASAGPTDQSKVATPFSIKITDPQGYGGLVEHLVPDGFDDRIVFGELKKKDETTLPLLTPKVHDFGDTRYRRVEYHLTGTTRFREYMPEALLHKNGDKNEDVTDENITLEGEPQVAWALNATSPAAPEVLYVVPMFAWTRGVDADGRSTSWRKGSGLRVWLDRPWNTTGYGEMLAVVLPPENQSIEPNDEPYKHRVTQWGNDPIWKSPYVKGVAPVRSDFRLRRTKRDLAGAWLPPDAPLSVAEQPDLDFVTQSLRYPGLSRFDTDGLVDIAPHDVFWDAERRLWYCDIQMAHGESYFPFVRMALARYQPSSLPDCYLSNIVQADFATLAPDRSMTVTNGNPTHRGVNVFGFSPEQSSAYTEAMKYAPQVSDGVPLLPFELAKSTIVEVWLEKLNAAQGEDFGWHKISDGVQSPYTTSTNTTGTQTKPVKQQAKPIGRQTTPVGTAFEPVSADSNLEAHFEWPNLWSGSVQLPTAPSASARYRVVVAEYEQYLTDGADPYETRFGAAGRRLVYVEHVELK